MIGDDLASFQVATTLTGGAQLIGTFAPEVVSMLIGNVGSASVQINFGTPATFSNGLLIPAAAQPLQLFRKDWGSILDQPLWAIPSSAGVVLVVWVAKRG